MNLKRKELLAVLAKFYKKPIAKVSFEFFISLITIIFFTIFAIRPTLLIIADLIKEIDDKQTLDQQMQKKIAALASAQEEYQLVQDKISLLDQAIPSSPELIKSLKTIEKIAGENKVIISNLKVSAIPEEKQVAITRVDQLSRTDIYFNLQAVGDYPALKNFAAALNQYRRAFVVEEVSFQIDDRIIQQTLRANMSIRAPYFGE